MLFVWPLKACVFLIPGECNKLHVICGVRDLCWSDLFSRLTAISNPVPIDCLDSSLELWPHICFLWFPHVCSCSIFGWAVGCQKRNLPLPVPHTHRIYLAGICQLPRGRVVTWNRSQVACLSVGLAGTWSTPLGHMTAMSLGVPCRILWGQRSLLFAISCSFCTRGLQHRRDFSNHMA